jgi:hypothetical protein
MPPPTTARAKIRQELVDSGLVGGKTAHVRRQGSERNFEVVLSDANAKPRLTLSVDRAGSARIDFLDDTGKVVKSITP